MRNLIVCTLVVSIVGMPATSSAGLNAPAKVSAPLKNVELSATGDLHGQLVTNSGLAVSGTGVQLTIGKQLWKSTTDASGRFVFTNVHGGRALLAVGGDSFACQLWANGTAPPKSIASVGLVASKDSKVRGQSFLPAPLMAPAAKIAALSTKQLIGLGLIVAGTTVGIAAAAADDDAS